MYRVRSSVYSKILSSTLAGVFLFSEITLPARLDSKIGTDFPHNTPIASELTPTNKIPNIKEIINNLTNLIFPAAYAYDGVKEEQISSVAEVNGQMGWRKVTDYLKNMANDTVDIEGKSVDDTVSEVVTVVVNPADTVITIVNGVDDTVKSEEGVNIQETKIEDAQTEVKVALGNMSDYIEKVTEEVKLIHSSMKDTVEQVRENISSIQSLNTQDVSLNKAKEFFGEVRVLVEELTNNLKAAENSSDRKVLFEEFFNRLNDMFRDYVEDLGQAANVRVVNEDGLKVEAKAEQKSEDTLVLSVKENITAGQKVNQEGAQSEVRDAGAVVITAQGMILPPARIDIPAGGAAVSAEAAVSTAGASVHNNTNNSSVGIVSQTIYVNNNGISAEYNSEVNVLSDQNNPPTTTGPPRINCAAYALSAYYGISLEAAAAILSQYTTYNSNTKQYETSLEGLKIAAGLQAREFKVSEISQLSGKNLLVVNGNHVVEYDADNGIVKDNGSEMTLSAFLCKYGLNNDTVISGLVGVEVGSEMNAEKLADIKVSWGASWGAAASAAASSGSSGSYGGVSWGGSSGSSFSSGRSSGSSSYGSTASSFVGGYYSSGSYGSSGYSDDSSYSTSSALISSVVSNFSSFSYTSYSDTSYNVTAPAFNFNAISSTSLSNYAPIYSTSVSLASSVIANFSAFSSALSSSFTFGQTMSAFSIGGGFFGGTANVGNAVSLLDFNANYRTYNQDIQTQVFTAFGGNNYAQVQPMIGAAMNGGITHIDLNPGNEYGATSLEINGSSAVIATASFISNSVSAAQGNADTFAAYCQITAAHETTEAETNSHYQALTAEAQAAQKSNLTAEQLSSWYETLHSGYENDANKAESYASRMMLAAGIAAEGETFVKALDEADKALNVVTEIGTPLQQQAAYVMQGDLFLALDKAVNVSKADNSAEVKEVDYQARAKESYENAAVMDTEHLVSMYANYMLMQMETNEENINLLMGRSKEALDQALQNDTLKADTMLSFLLSNNLLQADRYVELCYVMSCSLGKVEGIDTAGNSLMLQLSWLDKAASRIETAGEGQVNTDLAGNVYLQKSDLEYNIGLLAGDNFYKELAYKDIERAEELNPSDKAVWENHLQYLLADKDYAKFNTLLTDISYKNTDLSPQDNASIVGTYGQHFLWDTLKANNNDSAKAMDILKEQGWYECFIQSIEAQAYHAGLTSGDGSSFYANWTLSSEGVWHVLVLQSSGVWDAQAVVMVTNPFTNETVNLNSPEIMQNMFLIAPAIDGKGDDFKVAFVTYNKLSLEEKMNDGEQGAEAWDGSSLASMLEKETVTASFATISNPASDETPVIEVTGDKPVDITNSYLGDVVINAGDNGLTLTNSQGEKVEVVAEDTAQIEVNQNSIQNLRVEADESVITENTGDTLEVDGNKNVVSGNNMGSGISSKGDQNELSDNFTFGFLTSEGDGNYLYGNFASLGIESIGDDNDIINNRAEGGLKSVGDYNDISYNIVGGNLNSNGDYNTVAFNTVAGSVYSEGARNTIEYNQVGGDVVSSGSYNVIEHNIVGGDIVSSGDYNTINYNQVGGSVYSAGDYNTLTNNLIAGDLVSYGDYNLIGANQIGGSLFSVGDNNSVISNIVTGDINVGGNNNYVNGNIAGGAISVNGSNNIFGMNVQLSELAVDIMTQGNILPEGVNEGLIQRIIDTLLIGALNLSTWGEQTGGSAHASANGAASVAIVSGGGQGNSAAVNAVMAALGVAIKDTAAVIGQYGDRGSVTAQEGAVSATGKRGEGGDISYAGSAREGFAELGREITDAARSAWEKAAETVKEISGSKFSPVEVKDEQAQENTNPLMRAQEVINAQNKMAEAFDRLQEVSATARSAVDLPYNPAEAVSGGAGSAGAGGSGNPSIKGSNTIINRYPGLTGGILNSNIPVSDWAEGSLSGRGPPEGTLSLFSSIVSSSKAVLSIPDSSNPNSSAINNIIDSLNGIVGKLTADVSSGTSLSIINGDFRGQGPEASPCIEAPALIVSSAASDLPTTNNAPATQTKGGESWVSSILSSQTTGSRFLAAAMGLAGHDSSTSLGNRLGDTSTAGGKISAVPLPTQSESLSAAAETTVRPSTSTSSAVFSDERLSVKSSDSAPGTAEALAAMESWNGILLNGNRSYSEYISATSRNTEDIKSSTREQSWIYTKGTSFAVQAPSNSGRYSIGVYGRGSQAAKEANNGAGSVFSSIVSETVKNGENTLSRDYIIADTDNDGRGDSKVITAGSVYNAAGREVYRADYIGKSFTLAKFEGDALTVRESITFNPDNSLGTYSRESGFTAVSGIKAEIASDTWQIDYNKSESIHEVLNATDKPGEYISTITVLGAGEEEVTIAGTKDYSITGDGGWKSDTAGSIVSHGETLGSYMRMADYDAGGVLRDYSGRFDFNEAGAAAGYQDQSFGAELDVNDEGVLSGLTIKYQMDGSNGDKLADYSYRIRDINYLGSNSGSAAADEGFYTLAAFGQMFEECFEVDMFNMETVYDFARENGVQSYTYDFSYDGRIGGKEEGAGEERALSERMNGSWQLLESSVMRGGYAWSEKGEYAEQYTDSASVEKNTGLAAAKAYTFEQHYVDAKGLTLPAGTMESGYGLMRMDGGVFSMAVVKGEAVAADGVRRSVYYGVAIGEARGETGADAGSASGLGMGGSVLGNYLEEYYTPETMQGAGAFDIEVNLVLLAGANGAIFGFNKDYMLTSGQVPSPEYEMSGMPYGWYAWHCEGAISPVLQNPNHQVPATLMADEGLAAQYASQAYPVSNYVYYPVGSVNGQVVGVYMTYQDNENNYLLGQAVVPTGDGRSYIYNIYTANPGYYGDNAAWQAANQYIVENLENNGSAMFGVQTMAFTRAGDPANPSQYIPLSRVREYNGSDCSMYPQDKSFAKAMGFSYSENLAQMPREIETFWMTNSLVSEQELASNQWVMNPLRNMVQAGSLTALGNYVLGGEMEYGCCWEGVLTLVDRGVDGDVYANNRGNYYKTIGMGGFMVGTVPVVNVEGFGWQEYITDANNNIFVQYAPASGGGSAIYAYYDQETGHAVTDSADSFMRFYQVEGVGVVPVTVGLTGEGWVPLGSAQAEGEQVWVTPVQGGENIYERLEYDALAQAPWAGTGEYYRQDGQENWVKTTAPAAAVTLEERVFDCEKYSALTYGRENNIGFNADNDCAALAYAYLAAGKSGEEISEKEFFGLADNFKAASGMDEDGVSIEQMLKGFYSLGMNYKYEEVGSLKGLEAGAVILTEEDGMLHAMVLADNSGPRVTVYTCEEGWNNGGVELENIDPEDLTIKGALIPAGADASGLDRSMEITISVSSPGSIFYDNDSSYLYSETYFDAKGEVTGTTSHTEDNEAYFSGSVRALSHDGWTQSEIAEFIDGAQGVRTAGKAALPTAEQQKALETAAQTVVAPAYLELTGNTFDLDLNKVQIVAGTPLEEFTACVYGGYLWLNNAVFDDDGALPAGVLYHEQAESDILSGIVNPTEEDHKQAHLKAVQAEEDFEGYLVNINTDYYMNKGICLFGAEEPGKPSPITGDDTADNAASEQYVNKGISEYQRRGDYMSAIPFFDKAIEEDPSNIKAYQWRGMAYWELGHYDQALADFEEWVDLAPNDAEGYYFCALGYKYTCAPDEALVYFQKALDNGANNPAEINLQMGYSYRMKFDFETAEEYFDESIRISRSSPDSEEQQVEERAETALDAVVNDYVYKGGMLGGDNNTCQYGDFVVPTDPTIVALSNELDFIPWDPDDRGFIYKGDGSCYALWYEYDDNVYGQDWWQPPEVTIALGQGDCEDMAFLFCSLAVNKGYEAVVVHEPDHCYMQYYYNENYYIYDNAMENYGLRSNFEDEYYFGALMGNNEIGQEKYTGDWYPIVTAESGFSHQGLSYEEMSGIVAQEAASGNIRLLGSEAVKEGGGSETETLAEVVNNILNPYYEAAYGKSFDLGLTDARVLTGEGVEADIFVFEGYLYFNHTLFDDPAALSAGLLHEQYEKDLLDTGVTLDKAHLKATQAEEDFEKYLANINTGDSAGSGDFYTDSAAAVALNGKNTVAAVSYEGYSPEETAEAITIIKAHPEAQADISRDEITTLMNEITTTAPQIAFEWSPVDIVGKQVDPDIFKGTKFEDLTAVYDSETVTWYTTTKDASVLLHELYDNMFVQLEYDWQTAHEWATIVEDAFNKSAELPTINSFRELVDLKLPAGADSAIYHLGDSRVFHIEYNSVDEKNSAMERMVFFVEQTPGQVLSDSELSRQHYSGAASDFRMSDVADFYNNAGADVLNSKEAALRDELMELGLLSKDESGKYVGASDIAIISTSQNLEGYFKEHYGFDMGPLREGCIAHELNHALYFTDSNYKERVAEQWNGVPANEQGAIKLFLQGCCDINVSNQDVLLREYAAYFRDPFVDAAGVKSQIDRIGNGETFASNHKSLQSSLKTELSAGRLSNQFLSENSKSLLALEKNTIFTGNTGSGNTDGSVVKHADAGASNTNPHFGVEYTRDWLEKGHQLFDFKPFNEIELPDEEALPEISDFDPSGYFGLNGTLFTYGNCKDENIQKGFDILKNTEWAESEEGRKIIPIIDSFVKDGRVATADLPGNVKSYSPYVSMGDFEPGYINTWPQPVDPTYLAYVYVDSDLTPEEIAGRLAYIGSERLYVTSGRTTDGSVTWNVGTYEKTISNAYENAYNVDSELNINGYNPTKAQILDTHEFPSDKYLEQAYKLVTNSQWAQTEVGRNVVPLLEKSHDEGKITFGGTTEMGGAGDCDGDGNIRLSGTDMYWAGQMVGTLAHEGTHLLGSEYFSGDWRTRCSEHDPDVDLQAYRDCQTLFDEKPSFQSEYDCEKEFISWAVMPSDEQIVSAYRLADFFAGLGSESGSGTQNKLYVTAAGTQPQTITEIGTFQQKAPFTADNANPATISIGKTISENRGLWSLVDIVTSSGAVTDVKIDSQEKGYQFSFNNQNNKAEQYQVQLFERNTDGTYDDNSKAVSSQVSAKPDGQGNVQGTVDFHKSGEYALKISPVNSDGSAKGPYSVVEFTANPLPPSEDSGAGEIEINKNFSFTYRFDIGKSATENVDRYEISVSNPDGTGTVKLTDISARDSHFTASIPAPMGLGYTFQEDVISQLENNNMLGKDVKVSVAAVDDRGRSSIPGEATLSMPSALRTITPAEIMQEKGEYFKENSVAYTTLADGVSSYEMVYGRVNPQDPVVQQFAEWLDFDTSSGLTYKGEDGKTYRFVIPYQDNIKGEYGMQNPAYTLVQNNGDCDDLSAAYASILDAKNIEGMETIVGGYSGYDFGHCQAEAYYQGKYYMIDNFLWQERTWTTNYDSFIWDDKIYSGDKAKVENWMGVIKPAAVSHDGWTQSEIAEFIDGAQGVKTTGKAALPTAEQQKTLETAAQTVVAPVYAELTGNTFDLDLTNVMIVTGTPLEEFTACVYEGYLWLNNAVFDNDSAFLADVLYHEEVESDILSGIVNPTEEDHKQAHLKAVQAEEGFEGYLVNIKTGDSAGSGSGEEASYQELNDVIRQIEQISEADLRICPPDSNTKYWGIYLFNSDQYDNAEINKQITGLLETVDCFWSERTGPSPIAYEYTIFPEISREELQCEIHPVEGTVVIVQGEWALTNAKDENPKLSTWGIATCQGVLVYNQDTQTGAAAHIDFSHEVSSTLETLIEAVGTGDNIKIWLTDNADSMQVSVVEQRQDLEYEGILPRDFIFDTRNGEVTELSQGKSRELAGMEDSLTERNGIIDLRINNGITQCFRRYYKPADNG